ncbi:MAG: BamA/TamA family outer membrane protein, partial [Gammaproteobacteria bacterium]
SEEGKEKRKQALEGGESNAGIPLIPPSVSVLFGAYTENDTWLAGGAHLGVWKQDHIRYVGALARASVNLTFYGSSSTNKLSESNGLDFNGDGWFLLQEAKFRLHDSDWFVGGRFEYTSIDISFDNGRDPPGVDEDNLNRTETIGMGPIVSYDSRDNLFSPNRGIYAELEALFHSGSFIGDFNYQKYKAAGLFYWELHPKVVLGWRLDGRFAHGDTPFYALPFIDLRGIPAMRYQGDDVLVTELEARWNFRQRWSLVGFTGVGEAQDSFSDLFGSGDNGIKHTVGGGMRYLIARRLGLQAGFDVARGPEDTVFYLTVGSAWR